MKKQVLILTKNPYLAQKLRLYLEEIPSVSLTEDTTAAELAFVDSHSESVPDTTEIIRVGRVDADLKIPFGYEELCEIFKDREDSCALTLGEKCAYLRGEKIKLTEVEYSLLSSLLSKNGEFLSREELLRSVWQSEKSEGVLNVYIHYLREKLEGAGEKIIISSRKYGYKIDEKYLRRG